MQINCKICEKHIIRIKEFFGMSSYQNVHQPMFFIQVLHQKIGDGGCKPDARSVRGDPNLIHAPTG